MELYKIRNWKGEAVIGVICSMIGLSLPILLLGVIGTQP